MVKKLFFNAYITTISTVFCASNVEFYYDCINGIEDLNHEIKKLRTITQEHEQQLKHLQLEIAALRTAVSIMKTAGHKKKSHTR